MTLLFPEMKDRHVTVLAIALAGGFLALAIAALLLPPSLRLGWWLPLHLLLAGGASTAIAGVMPFFSAAVSGAPPARPAVRLGGVLAVATGALMVTGGRSVSPEIGTAGSLISGFGGLLYLGGLMAVAAATLLPLRKALGPRRYFMGAIYGLALLNAVLGVTLATLFVLGWAPVVAAWGALKPAHAWLNLFGFLSLVIAGSLLHLLPTVAAARIRRTLASLVTFVALSVGPLSAAAGYVLRSDTLVAAGAGLLVLGAVALAWHALAVMRSRARWTSEHGWHNFTTGSMLAAICWFVFVALLAAGQAIGGGSSAAAWDLNPLLVPLGVGWAAQVLVGSWSHLVPAVGPGTPEQHAAQRRILGQAALPRMVLANIGAAAFLLGGFGGVPWLVSVGALAVVGAGLSAVILLLEAMLVLRRPVGAGATAGQWATRAG